MAQLAKSTLLISTLVPLGSFKVCSDAKEIVECGKKREATESIQSLVKLQPWFLRMRWKTCLRQNCSLGSCACSEELTLVQNTLLMMINIIILNIIIIVVIIIIIIIIIIKLKVMLSPLQATKARGGYGCRSPHKHSRGTRKM